MLLFFVYNETGMSEAINIVEDKIESFGYKVEIINRWRNVDSTNIDFINKMEYVFEIDWGENEQDNLILDLCGGTGSWRCRI